MGLFHFIALDFLFRKFKKKILLTFKPYALILIGMNNTLNNVLLKYIIWYKETNFLVLKMKIIILIVFFWPTISIDPSGEP